MKMQTFLNCYKLQIPVCPDGFELLDNTRCVKIMDTGKAKTAADTDCKNENPRSTILSPKSKITHDKLEHYLTRSQLSPDTDFFLGVTFSDGQWKWDDNKEAVFTQSKFLMLLIISISKLN